MRIAEYKQIGTDRIENVITVEDYDNDGNVIGSHDETVVREVPVMGMVYRDATPEEIAEQGAAEKLPPEPTPEERIAALEEQNEMLTECILELSELLYN